MKTARTGSKTSLIAGSAIAAGIAVLARLIRHPSPDKVRGVFDRARWDDEPLTAEDEAAIAESEAEVGRGEVVTLAELEAELAGRQPPA